MKTILTVAIFLLLCGGALADDPGAADLQKCKICHSLDKDGANRVGPKLYGVFGRKAGTVPGFPYSDAMKNSDIVWDDDTLAKFLRDPKDALPGNRMSFPGIMDDAELHALLQSLRQATQ
jgi:cytochrome c